MTNHDDEVAWIPSVVTVLQYAFMFAVAHTKDFFARLTGGTSKTPKVVHQIFVDDLSKPLFPPFLFPLSPPDILFKHSSHSHSAFCPFPSLLFFLRDARAQGYAKLMSDFDDLFQRRLYSQISDCWNRPINSVRQIMSFPHVPSHLSKLELQFTMNVLLLGGQSPHCTVQKKHTH
jgi:hypothetical protein